MSQDFSADIDESVMNKLLIDQNGNLIRLDDLILPQYSLCRTCPLTKCAMRVDEPTEDYDDHCRIEEALIIEATKEHLLEGGDMKSKLILVSLFSNLLMVHRMQRVGSMIDYTRIVNDPKMLNLLDKFSMMHSRADTALVRAIKELQMTPKEKDKKKEIQLNTAQLLHKMMNDADNLDTRLVPTLPPTEAEKNVDKKGDYEEEMNLHDIDANNESD